MLFAGLRSVHIVKNCDLGLENAARGRSKLFFFGLFTQLLSCNGLARRLLTICKNLGNERVAQIVDKERCIKKQTFFELLYGSCIYFTS